MPNEIYELRVKQIKQWLDNGDITGDDLMVYLSQAINEFFTEIVNNSLEEFITE